MASPSNTPKHNGESSLLNIRLVSSTFASVHKSFALNHAIATAIPVTTTLDVRLTVSLNWWNDWSDRSRRLSILAEIGLIKFPQGLYRSCELWLLIDRTRYTWEIFTANGICLRSQYWYKHPDTALAKAKAHIDRELAVAQIKEIVGWV